MTWAPPRRDTRIQRTRLLPQTPKCVGRCRCKHTIIRESAYNLTSIMVEWWWYFEVVAPLTYHGRKPQATVASFEGLHATTSRKAPPAPYDRPPKRKASSCSKAQGSSLGAEADISAVSHELCRATSQGSVRRTRAAGPRRARGEDTLAHRPLEAERDGPGRKGVWVSRPHPGARPLLRGPAMPPQRMSSSCSKSSSRATPRSLRSCVHKAAGRDGPSPG